MKDLPDWLAKLAKKYECPRCHLPIDIEKIVGLGVKQSYKDKNREVIFFEYLCDKCDDMYVFEIDFADMKDFLPKLLDEVVSEDSIDDIKEMLDRGNFNRKTVSKISDREIKYMKKFLSSSKNFEEFMIEIGLTQDQINEYGQYNKEKDK